MLNGVVGFVVSGLKGTVGSDLGIRSMMEEAVGQGTAETLVKQDKEEGHAGALVGQAVGIAMTITFDQAMALHLA